jgi:hypothetical protein
MEETGSLETLPEVILLTVLKRETFQDDSGRKFSNFGTYYADFSKN